MRIAYTYVKKSMNLSIVVFAEHSHMYIETVDRWMWWMSEMPSEVNNGERILNTVQHIGIASGAAYLADEPNTGHLSYYSLRLETTWNKSCMREDAFACYQYFKLFQFSVIHICNNRRAHS